MLLILLGDITLLFLAPSVCWVGLTLLFLTLLFLAHLFLHRQDLLESGEKGETQEQLHSTLSVLYYFQALLREKEVLNECTYSTCRYQLASDSSPIRFLATFLLLRCALWYRII